jgi:hypothetical protein
MKSKCWYLYDEVSLVERSCFKFEFGNINHTGLYCTDIRGKKRGGNFSEISEIFEIF